MCVNYFLDIISMNYWLINILQVTNIESYLKDIYLKGFWVGIFSIVIAPPLFEELSQRFYLKSFVWNNTFVPINIGIIIILLFKIQGYYLLILCPIILIIANTVYSKVINYKKDKFKFLRFYINNYNPMPLS